MAEPAQLPPSPIGASQDPSASSTQVDAPSAPMRKGGWRRSLGLLLDEPRSSRTAGVVLAVVICAIIVSVFVFYLDTVPALRQGNGGEILFNLEATCVFIFTAEVGVRTIVGTLDVKRMLLLDAYYWVDLLSIVPFYAEMALKGQPPVCANAMANVTLNLTLDGNSSALVGAMMTCSPAQLPQAVRVMQLLRLMRILKLMRHYVDMRVLLLALHNAWRALLVPGFAMLLCILILSGALWLVQGTDEGEADHGDGFESLWCIFWIVSTLGYDGPMGSGGAAGQFIIAAAIIAGLILTTMPITVIGQAFGDAWKKKELIILGMRVQDLLVREGISVHEFKFIFDKLDVDGSGELDWAEFKEALRKLSIRLPVHKMRSLFESLDEDKQGAVSYDELCKALFPTQDWEKVREDHWRVEQAVTVVQAHIRGYLGRKRTAPLMTELGQGVQGILGSLDVAAMLGGRRLAAKTDGQPRLGEELPVGGAAPLHSDHERRLAALEQTMQQCCDIAELLLSGERGGAKGSPALRGACHDPTTPGPTTPTQLRPQVSVTDQ